MQKDAEFLLLKITFLISFSLSNTYLKTFPVKLFIAKFYYLNLFKSLIESISTYHYILLKN